MDTLLWYLQALQQNPNHLLIPRMEIPTPKPIYCYSTPPFNPNGFA